MITFDAVVVNVALPSMRQALGGVLSLVSWQLIFFINLPVTGVFNTSRQIGGTLAVAVFGTLLATPTLFTEGLRTSLFIAAAILLATAASSRLLPKGA